MPRNLGGYGILIRERGVVIGFIWALISKDSVIASIDYFGVIRRKRGNGVHGPLLMMRMLNDLKRMGKERIVGYMKIGAEYTGMLARLYGSVGADISEGYLIEGDIPTLIENTKRRGK